ncbi:MAG: response regulator [Holophagales bacterium]|nr:response regulator [Holophagales bacterium]
MSQTVKKHLFDSSDSFTKSMIAKIESDMKRYKDKLELIAGTIQYRISQGDNLAKVQNYIVQMGSDYESDLNSDRIYGYFTINGASGFIHDDKRKPPENYESIVKDRPWYKAALEKGGETAETAPYNEMSAEEPLIFAYSRCIYDKRDNLLGVVCISVPLKNFAEYVRSEGAGRKDGYGVLLDQNLKVIVHWNPEFDGLYIYDPKIPLKRFRPELEARKNVDGAGEKDFRTYKNEPAIVWFKKFSQNDWYVGIVALKKPYYGEITFNQTVIWVIGALCFVALTIVLISIDAARNRADMLNRQKSVFLANMSHEIRTPMNAILGISEIQMANESLPEDTAEALNKIHNSGNIMLGIINDILDLSKIESGKMELVTINYEVASVINDTVQLNIMRLESRPIEFKLDIDETIPVMLHGDELRIKQILNNLLSNAAKYTKQGEVELSIAAKPEQESKITLIFRIRDTGIGMTAEQVARLYDEYTRFNVEANRTTEGTGLGMSITKNLIQMMGGEIFVESEPDKGSVFTVRLPQGVADFTPLGSEIAENLRQFRQGSVLKRRKTPFVRKYMPYGRVLVVDDAQTNLYVAKGLMMPYGLQIDTAISGFEAVEKIKNGNTYDIIFMDHMMPEMDGIQATKILRGLGYDRPIVALTANALVGQADVFLANGFDAFLSKPIDVRQLNVLLNKMVYDKHPREAAETMRQQSNLMPENTIEGPGPMVDEQFAKVVVRDIERAVSALEAVCRNKGAHGDDEINLYTINVHAMKSVLANIGEEKLAKTALYLENAGKHKHIDAIMAHTPDFLESLKALLKQLKPPENLNNGDIANIDEDKVYLSQKLLVIQSACDDYDIGAAEGALNEIKQKTWSRQTIETLNSINDHLLHSDFEEAALAAANYAKTLTGNS